MKPQPQLLNIIYTSRRVVYLVVNWAILYLRSEDELKTPTNMDNIQV